MRENGSLLLGWRLNGRSALATGLTLDFTRVRLGRPGRTHPVATRARDTWPRAADQGPPAQYSVCYPNDLRDAFATPSEALHISVITFKLSWVAHERIVT
jgi:hypothetical protein